MVNHLRNNLTSSTWPTSLDLANRDGGVLWARASEIVCRRSSRYKRVTASTLVTRCAFAGQRHRLSREGNPLNNPLVCRTMVLSTAFSSDLTKLDDGLRLIVRNWAFSETTAADTADPGSERSPHQLSGGQQALLGLALVLALSSYQNPPLYLLDEVDAALDETNQVRRPSCHSTCQRHTFCLGFALSADEFWFRPCDLEKLSHARRDTLSESSRAGGGCGPEDQP